MHDNEGRNRALQKKKNRNRKQKKGKRLIVNIRGTSGSGKTTLVKRVMANGVPLKKSNQFEMFKVNEKVVSLVGSYKNACGGCDTVASLDEAFSIANFLKKDSDIVIMEGLLLGKDFKRTLSYHNSKKEIKVIKLSTPLSKCIRYINVRRHRKHIETGCEYTPVNPTNPTNDNKSIKSAFDRLKEKGVPCLELDRQGAYDFVMKFILEVNSDE